MDGLKDRVAIITGGGTGIGNGIALALARAGAKVVVCGRRMEPLDATAKAIRDLGSDALAIQADVSRSSDVRSVVDATMSAYGAVDILINNAGVLGGSRIHEHDITDWDRVMEANLRGPFLMARAVLPIMRNQRRGEIVNISSESGLEYYEGDGAYGVAKHALNALSEFIQRENQSFGIRVSTVCPGMVLTEMTRDRPGLNLDKCLYPDDIADLVMWLLTRRPNIKIGRPILIQTMENPWE